MDPITMMVASIGMQFFNNYANSKKNEEIQEKQREFQRAAAEHDFERMRKLQAESAKLALELEAEVHKERVEDINNNYDALLDNFAHSFAIQNWPLNVLPFVMKGESFGTLFNGTTQSVNLHCILTPSNCEWFNREFYDDIDLRLEAEMNNKWNAQTTHPIVYYGGAWNRRSMNRGISVPNVVDLDDIELLRVKLKDVPVVVITPYFDPWLHFKVKLWGMGKDSEAPYRIDIPHGNNIQYSQRIFSYDYHKDQTELTEDFENTTIEEFVPYLECLIGFIADKYFWSIYGLPPILHKNAEDKLPISLVNKEGYDMFNYVNFIDKESINVHGTERLLNFISECVDHDSAAKTIEIVRFVLCQICNARLGIDLCTTENLEEYLSCGYYGVQDLELIKGVLNVLDRFQDYNIKILFDKLECLLLEIQNNKNNEIENHFSYITLHGFLDYILNEIESNRKNEEILVIDLLTEERIASVYYTNNTITHLIKHNFRIDGFLVPQELKARNPSRLKIKRQDIPHLMDKLSFECDVNIFHTTINMESVIEQCRCLAQDIKKCNLYINNGIPEKIRTSIDTNLINHLIFCEIERWNDEVIQYFFYYDNMEGEIKDKFSMSNNLIIQ